MVLGFSCALKILQASLYVHEANLKDDSETPIRNLAEGEGL